MRKEREPQLKLAEMCAWVTDHIVTGAAARKIRESNGVSVRMMALRMKCSAVWLSDLERGRRNWTQEWVNRFNDALNQNKKTT